MAGKEKAMVWYVGHHSEVYCASGPTLGKVIAALVKKIDMGEVSDIQLFAHFVADDGPHYEGLLTVTG
jgi:hypothetical protein